MLRALLGLTIGLVATSAWSQNAVVGKQLYLNTNGSPLSCGSATCHGPDPSINVKNIKKGITSAAILNAINNTNEMKFLANAPFTVSAQQAADIAAFIINPAAGNATAAIGLSGTTLAFGSTQVAITNPTPMPRDDHAHQQRRCAADDHRHRQGRHERGGVLGDRLLCRGLGDRGRWRHVYDRCDVHTDRDRQSDGDVHPAIQCHQQSDHHTDRNRDGIFGTEHFAQRDVGHVQFADGRHDQRRAPGDDHEQQHRERLDHCSSVRSYPGVRRNG